MGSKPRKALLLTAFLLLFCCGCSRLYEGEYFHVTEVEETEYYDSAERNYAVRTYVGMKNAVQSLISSAAETGTIRVMDYSGSVQDDIARICLDATREFPMGAYAVEYISQSVVRILGYDEVKLRFSYRVSAEEMAEVRNAITLGDFYGFLEHAAESGQNHAVIQISSSSLTIQNTIDYLRNFYRAHPERLSAEPDVSVSFYPSENNVTKIVEFDLSFPENHEISENKLEELIEVASQTVMPFQNLTEGEQALLCCQHVAESIMDPGRGRTAYDALITGYPDSEGCAMAYKLLSNLLNLDCLVVEGRYNGDTRFWNIVKVDGEYYHVDSFACFGKMNVETCLCSDAEMMPGYWWDVDRYPDCSGSMSIQNVMDVIRARQNAEN